jgi:hypothetical protein
MTATIDEIDRFHKINYHSVFLAYKYAAKQMIAQGRGGRIIGKLVWQKALIDYKLSSDPRCFIASRQERYVRSRS